MENPIPKKIDREFLNTLKPENVIFAELIFYDLSAIRVRIWAIIDNEYNLFELIEKEGIQEAFNLIDEAQYTISVIFKNNFYSTWDPLTHNRFYFRKSNKIKFDRKLKYFVYDNIYLAKIDIATNHFTDYNESYFTAIIKQNFPNIQKRELTKRLERLKQLYFSAEPACFYHPLGESPENSKIRMDIAKQIVSILGDSSKELIRQFFGYEMDRVASSILNWIADKK